MSLGERADGRLEGRGWSEYGWIVPANDIETEGFSRKILFVGVRVCSCACACVVSLRSRKVGPTWHARFFCMCIPVSVYSFSESHLFGLYLTGTLS